jgi:hypothetical protein
VTTLALSRPSVGDRDRADRGPSLTTPSLLDDLGGEPTLDEMLAGVWEGLAAHRAVPCPVCRAELKPHYGAHARPIGGRCDGCGSSLS